MAVTMSFRPPTMMRGIDPYKVPNSGMPYVRVIPIIDLATGANYLTWIVHCDSAKTCKHSY